ncbi:cache domain-containing sensor histidine kinase [Paenibacillus methanolicus]|uniref:Two-component system sensor histidine kinase YesM n=1 Tax=Paenibacillus methanolicus TaxID=582686 RepID=A0A5S5CGP2_9BACL|nr:sensor histidine kinase [Paenibacillus methanolicus]TYP78946.1 two-component system sensor histidine kinase YesM [Paenibacillus methanolicus]
MKANANAKARSKSDSRMPANLRSLSIKNRLIAAFLITSLLPVAFVAFYSNAKYTASVTGKLSASSQQTLTELARNVSRELAQYETLTESIIINPQVQRTLPRYDRMSDYEKSLALARIKDELEAQVFSISNLYNVMILTPDGGTIFDLGFQSYPREEILSLRDGAGTSPGNAYWTYLRSNRGSNMIALTRTIYAEDDLNRRLGYVILVIDEKVFSRNTYHSVDLGRGSRVYISDAQGMVVSSVEPDIAHGELFEEEQVFRRVAIQAGESSFYGDVDGERQLVTSARIPASGWYVIGLLPRSFLVSEVHAMSQNVLIICLFTLLLAGMLALWIYRSIHEPIRKLLHYAKQVSMGQLDTPLSGGEPDEMGRLTGTINQMVVQLRGLIHQVESGQQAKRDAELKMLQAQINPHFLFNTLNSLKWSAMMSGSDTVASGLTSLSELLRNTILDKADLIPLEEEIGNLLHYATIQRIRYGDSFELGCSMAEEELYQWLVPKFILQPIVENSILHAGSEDGRRVGIWVEGLRDGSKLRLRVADDGKGFDVASVKRRQSHAKLSGIGIDNVHERIRIDFGSPYGLEVRSEVNRGTETVILLPMIRKEENQHVQSHHRG